MLFADHHKQPAATNEEANKRVSEEDQKNDSQTNSGDQLNFLTTEDGNDAFAVPNNFKRGVEL